jgi:hypothetical protein
MLIKILIFAEIIKSGISHIFQKSVELAGKAISKREDSDDSEAEEDDVEDMGEEEYHKALTKLQEAKKKGEDWEDEDDEDEDDEDYMAEGTDMDLYVSPLDSLDELMFFRTQLERIYFNINHKINLSYLIFT